MVQEVRPQERAAKLLHSKPFRARSSLTIAIASTCALLLVLAVFGPWLAPYSPTASNILESNLGPSSTHWLGTDSLGRDVLSRLLWGIQLSYLGAATITLIAVTVSVAIALFSAWVGGRFDAVVGRSLNIFLAIPMILVAILTIAILGPGFWAPVIGMSIAAVPFFTRVLRSATLQERHKPYIEALELSGVSALRINIKHILKNLSPLVLAQATFLFGVALMEFGALSFLGLGIQPPTAELGAMILAGRNELLAGNYQQTLAAGTALVVSIVAFNVMGERISTFIGGTR